MTKELDGTQVTRIIEDNHPGMVLDTQGSNIWIQPDVIRAVATLLKQDPDLLLSTLRAITAVDYVEYFEIIYHLLSMKKNQSLVLKLKCFGRDEPVVDSVKDILISLKVGFINILKALSFEFLINFECTPRASLREH